MRDAVANCDLPFEPRHHCRYAGAIRANHFECLPTPQLEIFNLVYVPHPATRDETDNFEAMRDDLAGSKAGEGQSGVENTAVLGFLKQGLDLVLKIGVSGAGPVQKCLSIARAQLERIRDEVIDESATVFLLVHDARAEPYPCKAACVPSPSIVLPFETKHSAPRRFRRKRGLQRNAIRRSGP